MDHSFKKYILKFVCVCVEEAELYVCESWQISEACVFSPSPVGLQPIPLVGFISGSLESKSILRVIDHNCHRVTLYLRSRKVFLSKSIKGCSSVADWVSHVLIGGSNTILLSLVLIIGVVHGKHLLTVSQLIE